MIVDYREASDLGSIQRYLHINAKPNTREGEYL
jgi:hypothetical protein